jgi:A/G-specific adenine glycosylase
VVERVRGMRLTPTAAERAMVTIGRPLRGRDRLLALMDVGAVLCRPRDPRCAECPLRRRCATRGPLADERRSHQGRFEGSFRERRGHVMAKLRQGSVPTSDVDADALASLVQDGLAEVKNGVARLPELNRPAEAANGAGAE